MSLCQQWRGRRLSKNPKNVISSPDLWREACSLGEGGTILGRFGRRYKGLDKVRNLLVECYTGEREGEIRNPLVECYAGEREGEKREQERQHEEEQEREREQSLQRRGSVNRNQDYPRPRMVHHRPPRPVMAERYAPADASDSDNPSDIDEESSLAPWGEFFLHLLLSRTKNESAITTSFPVARVRPRQAL
ncbi:hypothetical protein FPV67DRAFT_1455102 [Lyophyllum atratum]|nr:hypothetical protein FPV67DRAFT_1455102 [Lyophyllum atratum]